MRVLFFLVLSSVGHWSAFAWCRAAIPRIKQHESGARLVFVACALVLPALRLVQHLAPNSQLVHVTFAFATMEVVILLVALPFIAAFSFATRAAEKAVAIVRPTTPEEKDVRVSRRVALERVAGATTFGVTSLTLGWGSIHGRHDFQIEEVVIKLPRWPRALDGYTIAQISDIHVGAFIGERELGEGFDLVRRIRPDLLVATGDLVDNQSHVIGQLLAQMQRISARDGLFAILGNHDHYAGAADVAETIRASRVRLLANANERIRPDDGGGFILAGVDDLRGRGRDREEETPGDFGGPDLAKALRGIRKDLPRVLLAHQPQYFDEAKGSIDLQLSGHTHGGQINPGFRPAELLMKYISGRYDGAGSTLYVNRGFGTTGPPSRVRAAPEITKLVLVSG